MDEEKSEEILIKKLIQWHLDEQWRTIKNFAKACKIKLIGDLPFMFLGTVQTYGVINHYLQFLKMEI